jgi:hypothetical protein
MILEVIDKHRVSQMRVGEITEVVRSQTSENIDFILSFRSDLDW